MLDTVIALAIIAGLALLLTYLRNRADQKKVADMSLKDFFRTVEMLAPVLLPLVPGIPAPLVPVIVHGIQVAENVGGTGAEKKAQAIDLVKTGIIGVNVAAGKQVIDPTVINAVGNGIDTVVGVVNIVHKQPVDVDKDL